MGILDADAPGPGRLRFYSGAVDILSTRRLRRGDADCLVDLFHDHCMEADLTKSESLEWQDILERAQFRAMCGVGQ